jgi:hypothetical protein
MQFVFEEGLKQEFVGRGAAEPLSMSLSVSGFT